MNISWKSKPFDYLTPAELYDILRLRSEVFVVEQDCVFQDMDNKDQYCQHLMGYTDDKLIAYTRIIPVGISYDEYPSIGRVVTSPSARGNGIGKLLMEESIKTLIGLYGETPIRIGAQVYLVEFYHSFGFEKSSDIYDEDGIDHVEMTRSHTCS